MPDVLGHTVLEQGEILLLQIRDGIALTIHDADVHGYHGDADPDRRERLRGLLRQRADAGQQQRDGWNEQATAEQHPRHFIPD